MRTYDMNSSTCNTRPLVRPDINSPFRCTLPAAHQGYHQHHSDLEPGDGYYNFSWNVLTPSGYPDINR